MNGSGETPKVHPGGLVTIAFLKAKLDEGSDHLGIFMPLILDVISTFKESSFVTSDIQAGLASTYKLVMPQHTVDTLLKRATRQKILKREYSRYTRAKFPAVPNIAVESKRIQEAQGRLADALAVHAKRRGMVLNSQDALDLLFRFLEEEQIALLLDTPASAVSEKVATSRERAVIAEFVEWVVKEDAGLRAVLNAILEGLVLYHAAFLPDLTERSRRFKNLQIYFDSDLVRRALGYEGPAMQTLLRETVKLLTGEGARCLVFDKTVDEIQRILQYFEGHIGTAHGRRLMRPSAMTRHFFTARYTPSDIREMEAMLEQSITSEGFRIMTTPRRDPKYTALEKALQTRLADPVTKDESLPRIAHDVDCTAGILTLRRGHTSQIPEDSRFLFASSSVLVIRNTRLWYEEDERGVGIGPIVHIRALSNLAFLKSPKLCAKFKEHELVALCAAAMRPKYDTWQRFLKHLNAQVQSNKITSDEMALILVSRMSDQLLREAENNESGDVDAETLDDVIERVKTSYTRDSDAKLAAEKDRTLAESARADATEQAAAERERVRDAIIARRAQTFARWVAKSMQWVLAPAVLVGAIELIIESVYHLRVSFLVTIAVVVFILLEALAHLRRVSEWRSSIETVLAGRLEAWFRADSSADSR